MTCRIEAKLSSIPSNRPAATAPGNEPIPPTTTTTNEITKKQISNPHIEDVPFTESMEI